MPGRPRVRDRGGKLASMMMHQQAPIDDEPPELHPQGESDPDSDFESPEPKKRRGRPPGSGDHSLIIPRKKTPTRRRNKQYDRIFREKEQRERELEERERGRGRPKGSLNKNTVSRQQPNITMSDAEGSLFEIVKSGRTALSTVVDDWIESYKQDRDTALLDLIQFFIHCSGCRGTISPQMYHNMEHAEIIRKMTEEFDEESGDYPLILSGPMWKKFRLSFCDFISVLVRQCQYSIIYDQYMMDNVISLLTGLTDSQVRAFRHTSTLAAMKLMSALVDVALNLSINLDHTQRQYDAERLKNKNKQASERLEVLLAKRQEIEENQEEIRNMLTYIFKGVFVHRYRDTQPEIRSICMAEIGVWMKRYPAMFLDDSYLKYVGWTLYDRSGEVRGCCLKCLQPLYDTNELSPKLELFTNRFKDRIVEMTLDKEYDVAVQAVKLVISILRFSDNVLSGKDCENVYELVYSSHRAVAQSAGEFLNDKLFNQELDEETRNQKTKKGKLRSENTSRIRDLVQFFIESELHEHGAYLVDSLWEINEMLKDWVCMTDLLLEEPGKGEEHMDDRQETSLIEIMVCCVKQAATGEYPVGRGPTRKLTSKEGRQVMEDKTRLTEHFIIVLPQLLAKYAVDAEKIANLLQIPLYFDLEIYTTSRLEKYLDSMLRHINDIVEKHTDSEVLENCSKVLEVLCNDEYNIASKCNTAKSTLIDNLAHKFKEAFADFFTEGEEPDEDDAYALMASLKRIYAFFSCHNINQWGLWDQIIHIVKMGQEGGAVPDEIICKAIACCSMSIIWFLDALDEHAPERDQMKALKKKLGHLMRTCHSLMLHNQDKVQEEAYITVCDMLIIFGRHLGNNALLQPLVFEADAQLQEQLGTFLKEKVFIEDEDEDMDENQKIEELHKRRNFLASFCKLIVYNSIPIQCGADMFKHYMRYYNDYGDIIKATLGKSREINKVITAKTLALSLTRQFREIQDVQGWSVERGSEPFLQLKELARRFSLSFGLDQVKNREAVAAMHKEGILFSLTPLENPDDPTGPPPNLSFLEILCEFTGKLMKQDKKVVLQFLDKNINMSSIPAHMEAMFTPLLTYRHQLTAGEWDQSSSAMKPPASSGRGRGRPPKRKLNVENTMGEEQWMSETIGPRINAPLTSTAIKKKRGEPVNYEEPSEHSELGSEGNYESKPQSSQASWLQSQKTRKQLAEKQNVETYHKRTDRPRRSSVKLPVYQEENEEENEQYEEIEELDNQENGEEIESEEEEIENENTIVEFSSPKMASPAKRRRRGPKVSVAVMKVPPPLDTPSQDTPPQRKAKKGTKSAKKSVGKTTRGRKVSLARLSEDESPQIDQYTEGSGADVDEY